MHITLDYLITSLVIIILLVSSIYIVISYSNFPVSSTEIEQMRTLADKTLNLILLSDGSPVDWGSDLNVDSSDLKGFGLHRVNAPMYVLDPDKIGRLHDNSPYKIDPTDAAGSLGFYGDGYLEKGFCLMVIPVLKVDIREISPHKFEISVADYEGRVAPNVLVRSIYFAINVSDNKISSFIWNNTLTNMTDYNGMCLLDYTSWASSINANNFTLIVYAEQYGLESVGTYPPIYPEKAEVFAYEHQIVTKNPGSDISDEIIALASEKSIGVFQVNNLNLDDELNIVLVVVDGRLTLVQRPYPVNYGTQKPGGLKTVCTTKFVTIGRLTYVARLCIWRMSE